MKTIKRKIMYFVFLALVGIVFVILGNTREGGNAQFVGFGTGILAVSILKVLQYIRLSRDPEKMKQFEIMQNEERVIFLVQKSAYHALLITEMIELIAMAVLILIGRSNEATIVAVLTLLQLCVYLILYWIYQRKY